MKICKVASPKAYLFKLSTLLDVVVLILRIAMHKVLETFFTDECEKDDDCNNGGECIEISTTYPKKQCFCAPGYFGSYCQNCEYK